MVYASPTPAGERIRTLDVLRGFAVLGILLINIRYMALPMFGWHELGANAERIGLGGLGAWLIGQVFFEDKMMLLFTLLFGAGIVLLAERAAASGRRPWLLHYQRVFWLCVVGHAHAYLIWFGDILIAYSLSGALVYPLRRLRPRLLLVLGAALFATSFGLRTVPAVYREMVYPALHDGEALARPEPTAAQVQRRERWAEAARAEPAAHAGGYLDGVRWRAALAPLWHYDGYIRGEIWRGCGVMLLGMGLFKLGLFSGRAPPRVQLGLVALGYAVGIPLVGVKVYAELHAALGEGASLTPALEPLRAWVAEPSAVPRYLHRALSQVGVLCVALGNVGVVLLVCRSARAGWLVSRLGAAGRMALTNYLLDSVLALALFDLLGWWDTMSQAELAAIVLLVWAAQLALCPVWLARFRFGPAEWLWRSLTYRRVQPMRVARA